MILGLIGSCMNIVFSLQELQSQRTHPQFVSIDIDFNLDILCIYLFDPSFLTLYILFCFPQSSSIQMEDWVLCRVFLKRRTGAEHHEATESCKEKNMQFFPTWV